MAIDFHEEEGEDKYEDHAEPSMNTTPLIDVLLVLLVMLIITIPIQLHSVNMDLPAGLPPPDAPEPIVVRLELSSSNRLEWNGEPVMDRAALDARFLLAAQQAVQPEIHLHADAKTKYDAVAAVLTAAQRQGLLKIGVVGLDAYAKGQP
jgi:biopolymer transport protein ExbD